MIAPCAGDQKGSMSLMCGGGGGGQAEISPEEARVQAEAKKQMAKELADDAKIIKMLLLGAGESGKSTIFKQMKVINKGGFSEKERKEFVGARTPAQRGRAPSLCSASMGSASCWQRKKRRARSLSLQAGSLSAICHSQPTLLLRRLW